MKLPIILRIRKGARVKYRDLGSLIAEAIHPVDSDNPIDWCSYGGARISIESMLSEQVAKGKLRITKPEAPEKAYVRRKDLRALLAREWPGIIRLEIKEK